MADPAGREAHADLLTHATDPSDPADPSDSPDPSAPPDPEGRSLGDLARELQALALARAVTVGTAESCTGGLVGHAITSVPGSSGYYLGGIVSYADQVKADLLGVPLTTLERHGAVSAQTAVAMAEGLRTRVGCGLAVAVTGVAGPDGGSPGKPVGLTYVAIASDAGHEVRRYAWDGGRAANKESSAVAALRLLIEVLQRGSG